MRTRMHGFTLVEMVVSITISAILMGMIAMIMGAPVQAYIDQARRNELVEASDRVTRTLASDFIKALPNSVRTEDYGNIKVVQMLEVRDVVFYHDETGPMDAVTGLNFTTADDQFSIYGSLSGDPSLLVVNNAGTGAADAYGPNDVLKLIDTPGNQTSRTVSFSPAFKFSNGPSPTNRMFAIKGPVTYICNLATGQLTRFADHAREASTPVNESDAQLQSAGTTSTVATGITACDVQCALPAGNNPCQHALTLTATLTRGAAPDDDSIRIVQSYPVENTP